MQGIILTILLVASCPAGTHLTTDAAGSSRVSIISLQFFNKTMKACRPKSCRHIQYHTCPKNTLLYVISLLVSADGLRNNLSICNELWYHVCIPSDKKAKTHQHIIIVGWHLYNDAAADIQSTAVHPRSGY